MRLFLRPVVVIGLLLAVPACGDRADGPAGPGTSEPTTVPVTTSTPPTTSAPTTPAPPTTAVPTTAVPTTTVPGGLVDVKVYLVRDTRLVIAHRQVAGPAILRGAVTALLEGPTAAERTAGLTSAVPADTSLLDLALADGTATVDLSGQYGTGGGSLSMQSRVAQVVFTATQFANADQVVFRMDGAPVEFLGGEGLVLTEPQTRMMVDRELTGSVLIDTPTPGATVRSPFTVTGEGDVYEGQFPIEVWAGGRQIGGVAPVWAGAWGTWAPFEATITLDAPSGPIELVAYDEGGCGTDPECPATIKTVVPLTLAG